MKSGMELSFGGKLEKLYDTKDMTRVSTKSNDLIYSAS